MLKKKIWASFQRIMELFTQKFVTNLSKIWVRDPGSGKNLFQGSRGQKGTGSRIRSTGFYNAKSSFIAVNASLRWHKSPDLLG
jgi:hypothetical protein